MDIRYTYNIFLEIINYVYKISAPDVLNSDLKLLKDIPIDFKTISMIDF